MKTLIVGTGVIGVIYGWALHQAGVEDRRFSNSAPLRHKIATARTAERPKHAPGSGNRTENFHQIVLPEVHFPIDLNRVESQAAESVGHEPKMSRLRRWLGIHGGGENRPEIDTGE